MHLWRGKREPPSLGCWRSPQFSVCVRSVTCSTEVCSLQNAFIKHTRKWGGWCPELPCARPSALADFTSGQSLFHLYQDFLNLVLLTFWTRKFFSVGGGHVPFMMFYSIPGLYPLDANSTLSPAFLVITAKNVPCGASHPQLKPFIYSYSTLSIPWRLFGSRSHTSNPIHFWTVTPPILLAF